MYIDSGLLLNLVINFFIIYCSVYFFYTYFKKGGSRVASLFQPGISVIIPAYNEESNIKLAVDSCLNQSYNGDVEVIVVDDGSTDNTRKICRDYVKRGLIKLILKNKPGSPTGKISSVNLGIKRSKHDIVGILDADSFLDKNVFKELAGDFENQLVGAAVPIMKVHKPRNFLERLQSIEYTMSMCIRRLMASINCLFMTHGVGCLFRKSALKKVGYFKENTLTEDLNISLKLIKAGYQVTSSFRAVGYTKVPSKMNKLMKQRLRWNGGFCENIYWFKGFLMNKKYGNLGLFILPINMAWTGLTIYFLIQVINELIKFFTNGIKDLLLTGFDWGFLLNSYFGDFNLINFNPITVISMISLGLFMSFYYITSRRIGFNNKQIINNMFMFPFYFTVYFFLLGVFWLMTPFYMIKHGGVGWSVKS